MGIYPHITWDRKLDKDLNWVVVRTEETPGLKITEVYRRTTVVESRTDCFCCTCDLDQTLPAHDAACRNHGYYGKRPCEEHNMPGYCWEGTTDMPESVQAYRKRVLRDNI